MKLGTQTASLSNHLLARAVIGQPEPVVGMGATVLGWTDRHPATIVSVDGNLVTVRQDNAERVDSNGLSESQEYEYTPNENGSLYIFRKSKSGEWEEVRRNEETGRLNKIGGKGLRIGEREKYHDFSF